MRKLLVGTRKGVFVVERGAPTRLEILSLDGRTLSVPLDRYLESGEYNVPIDTNLPSGTYLCRLRSGGRNDVRNLQIVH